MNEHEAYERDRPEADNFIAVQIDVTKKLFRTDDVKIANYKQDTKEVTDAVVDGVFRLAYRIRGHSELKYWNECTLRNVGGDNSELSKMVRGKGDWMLYGFRSAEGKSFAAWSLLWFEALRKIDTEIRDGISDPEHYDIKVVHPSNSGQNSFVAVVIDQIPGFVTATTDERLWTPTAELWTPDGKLLRAKAVTR